MKPLLYTSIKDYNAVGPLPWIEEYDKKTRASILKVIKTG